MPNRPLDEVEFRSATREAWGLPEDKFIFCSFNALPKFSLRTIAMWGRILAALPDARFWIRCDLEIARQSLLKELGTHGVDPGQIIFAPGAGEFAEHIGRLALGDLALDPTPITAMSRHRTCYAADFPSSASGERPAARA